MLVRLPYNLLWIIALPFVMLRLIWRGRRQPGYLEHVGERFGRYGGLGAKHTIWIHAVSVGETRAAEPLLRAILQRHPDHDIVLTHMTPTGRETSEGLFADEPRVTRVYLPYDIDFLVERFLRHFRPKLGVVMETELWPNLLLACQRHAIPVILANARLSERSARRYARWPAMTRLTLGALSAVGAQTANDANRMTELGAREVEITGNIKFDISAPDAMLTLAALFRARFGARPVLLAASTRDGEEALILDAFQAHAPANVLLVLVPRHPQRFDAVADIVRARRLKLQRRSDNDSVQADTRVWLGDSMGEMFAYFAASEIALIGGSWLPFGGQNLIEACAVGTPVIIGPHTFNFSLVAEQAVDSGAALRAETVEEGVVAALALLRAPEDRGRAGAAGKDFANAHRGATVRTMAIVEGCLLRRDTGT